MKFHIVRKGETLGQIARRYSKSSAELRRANAIACPQRLAAGRCILIPEAPEKAQRPMELCAFFREESCSPETLDYCSYIAPYACRFDEGGELYIPDSAGLLRIDQEKSCANLLCLANLGEDGAFSSPLAHRLFCDEAVKARLLGSLFDVLEQGGYYGLQLCFNYIFPFDKENYSSFARELSRLLHEKGYLLSIELAPPESPGLDYAALGLAADRISLMYCRWGHGFGPPQALSPFPALLRALDYAAAHIPANKLLLGISGHGYDWPLPWRQGRQARPISHSAATELAGALGAEIIYDTTQQAPGFDYTDPEGRAHRIWFEDGRSLSGKLELVESYGLAGLSLYCADRPWPELMQLMDSYCAIEKLL